MGHIPKAVVKIVVIFDADAFVLGRDVGCRHDGLSDGQGVIFALGHDGNDGLGRHRRHLGVGMGQA